MSGGLHTVRELLALTKDFFVKKEIETPRLDAEILLAFVLGKDRVALYCSLDLPVEKMELDTFRALVQRRANREPIAYITGRKEFYGLDFKVCPGVLIPRPDTETLVEHALELLKNKEVLLVCDIGTGSGAIAVAIAKNNLLCTVHATDVDSDTLSVAEENAKRHQIADRVTFFEADLFAACQGQYDLILSNPPYICEDQRQFLAPEIVKYEPHLALFSGQDGLNLIRRLVDEALGKLKPGGSLVLEIGEKQGESVINYIHTRGVFDTIEIVKDLAGKDRVVSARGFRGVNNG